MIEEQKANYFNPLVNLRVNCIIETFNLIIAHTHTHNRYFEPNKNVIKIACSRSFMFSCAHHSISLKWTLEANDPFTMVSLYYNCQSPLWINTGCITVSRFIFVRQFSNVSLYTFCTSNDPIRFNIYDLSFYSSPLNRKEFCTFQIVCDLLSRLYLKCVLKLLNFVFIWRRGAVTECA